MNRADKDQGYIRVTERVVSEGPLPQKLPFLGRKLDDLTKPEERDVVHVPICRQDRAREPERIVPRFTVPTGIQK